MEKRIEELVMVLWDNKTLEFLGRAPELGATVVRAKTLDSLIESVRQQLKDYNKTFHTSLVNER